MKTSYLLLILGSVMHYFLRDAECLLSRSVTTSGNETDRAALLGLKAGLAGSDSGLDSLALSSWNASRHFCKWEGVTCEGQRVTALDLVDRNTGGFISPFIGNLSFLRIINLSGNRLNGLIPEEIGLLPRLEIFNVSNNALEGGFPLQLANCTSLLIIELAINSLNGVLPDHQHLGSMPNLRILSMAANNFTGEIPASLGNISSLSQLGMADNLLQGSIPSSLGRLKNLTLLSLQENSLSGPIPSSFYNLTSLQVFSFVVNRLSGTISPNLGSHFPHLRIAFLGKNNFTGTIPPTLSNISGLQIFDVFQNHFHGNVPQGLERLQYLARLNLEYNNLGSGNEGDLDFITSLTNLTGLKRLNIRRNRLGGTIPNSIGNLSGTLENLLFGYNMISGHIPVEIGNLGNLVVLGIEYNNLTGEVPSSIGNLIMLRILALGGNGLQGTIPPSLGNLKNMYILGFESNQLEGSIPLTLRFCSRLQYLYLSKNKLSGTVSTEIISSLTQLIWLDLDHNSFTGRFPAGVGRVMILNSLDIAYNKFSGEMPAELGKCLLLEFLEVQENFFDGRIPQSLSSLKGLEYADLSRNKFSGLIPAELQELRNLKALNISFNQLEGKVPKKGVFSNLTGISLQGNEKLCGGIPKLHLPNCSSRTSESKNEKRRIIFITFVTVGVFFCLVLTSLYTWVSCRKVSKRTSSPSAAMSVVESGPYLRLSFKQLWDATDQFSVVNIIGVGSFGSVYSGVFNGKPIAVKVMNLQRHGAIKSFEAECQALSKIRHRNLLQILSCCSSLDSTGNDFIALVYELMPNGSLDRCLHELKILTLRQRLDIAIDVASALEYLHHDCEPQIVHCDLKPSNVLLDEHMVARLGDFGLAKLVHGPGKTNKFSKEQASISSAAIRGTVGYVPPEYGMGANVSTEGDVYSYGILLLELITGKRPTDETFKDGTNLHIFCASAFSESRVIEIIVDSHLLADLDSADAANRPSSNSLDVIRIRECIEGIVEIGLGCSKESPNERMDIRNALKMLLRVKMKLA